MLPGKGVIYLNPEYSAEKIFQYFQAVIQARLSSIDNETHCDIQVDVYVEGLLNVFHIELIDALEPYVRTSLDRKTFDGTPDVDRKKITPQDYRLQLDREYFKNNSGELFSSAKSAVKSREDANDWEICFCGQGIELLQKMGFDEDVKHRITVRFFNLPNLYVQNETVLIQRLAKIFAYFEAGRKPLLERIHVFEQCGIDPNKLPQFSEEDLKFICFELKIDYVEFKKVFNNEKRDIDLDLAQETFTQINIAALMQFDASPDGIKFSSDIRGKYSKLKEDVFRARLIILIVRAAGLSLLNETSILFPQPDSSEYVLQALSQAMTIVYGKPIQFYTQHEYSHKKGNELVEVPWTDPVNHSDTKMLSGFIRDLQIVFKSVLSPDDSYDFDMIDDLLDRILCWYTNVLNLCSFKNYDKTLMIELDGKFWTLISAIAQQALTQLNNKSKGGLDKQILFLKLLHACSTMYMTDNKKTKEFQFSPNKSHLTRNELLQWSDYLSDLKSNLSVEKDNKPTVKHMTAKAYQYGTAANAAHSKFFYIRSPNLGLKALVFSLNELAILLEFKQPRKNQVYSAMTTDELKILEFKLNIGKIFHFAFETESNVLHVLRVIHEFIGWYQLLLTQAISCENNEYLPYEQVFWAQIPHALDKINKEMPLASQILPSWQQSARHLSIQIIKDKGDDKLSKVNEFLTLYHSVFASDPLCSSASQDLVSLMKKPENTTVLFNMLMQGMVKLDDEILTQNLTFDPNRLTVALRK